MPKKNGFVMYLESRKQSLLDEGHTLDGGLKQLAELCDDGWKELPQTEKMRFSREAEAYNEQQVLNYRGAFAVGDMLRSLTSKLPQPSGPSIQKTKPR